MAPADSLSAAGSSSYSSDTLTVGDGTWDYTTNTFLLPNLVGLNFDTMRYNGMGNRFSTIPQYHRLITGHGVMAAITFLFIIPASVITAQFYTRHSAFALRYHGYLNTVAVFFSTVVLILGWFAVGPSRSLTNPHHGIGIAIYVLVLVQAMGGRLVRHLAGRHSLRLTLHRWLWGALALLGIVQVALGLTLYGSPKALFILYAIWCAFLLLIYFILCHRYEGRSEVTYVSTRTSHRSKPPPSESSSGGGVLGWLGPLAAGVGALALLRSRNRGRERSQSRRPSRSRVASRSASRSVSRSRSRSHGRHDIVASRTNSDSFIENEKYANRRRTSGSAGFMSKLLGAGAAAGAGALLTDMFSKRKKTRNYDEEYSAVDTDTPSRYGRSRVSRVSRASRVSRSTRMTPGRSELDSEVSYFTESTRPPARTESPTPAPRRGKDQERRHSLGKAAVAGVAAGAAAAALSSRRNDRPVTPRPSHQRTESIQDSSRLDSDYSYQSPSRRESSPSRHETPKKGFLGGMGLGWLTNRMKGGQTQVDSEQMRREEEDRRSGGYGSRYTGDVHPSPARHDSRRDSRHGDTSYRPPPAALSQTLSEVTDSVIEPVVPPVPLHSTPPRRTSGVVAPGASGSRRRSTSRPDTDRISMPSMPDTDSDSMLPSRYGNTQRYRRRDSDAAYGGESSSRRRDSDAGYVSSGQRGDRHPPSSSTNPISVRLKVHDDRGNVTLRRLTDSEAAGDRSGPSRASSSQPPAPQQRRRASSSASSMSDEDSPTAHHYRRERRDSNTTIRQAERTAEGRVSGDIRPSRPASQQREQSQHRADPSSSSILEPLEPPRAPFAGGRRNKDSAYYSGGATGQAGPSGTQSAATATVSTIESPITGSVISGSPGPSRGAAEPPNVSSDAAAERRRRRRLERSDTSKQASRVEFQ